MISTGSPARTTRPEIAAVLLDRAVTRSLAVTLAIQRAVRLHVALTSRLG